jgi:chromosome segregation ATPase
VKRYDIIFGAGGGSIESSDGIWVEHNAANARIAELQAMNQTLSEDLASVSEGMHSECARAEAAERASAVWHDRYDARESEAASLRGKLARGDALLLSAHPIVARSQDQGLRGAINHHLKQRECGFEDTCGPPQQSEAASLRAELKECRDNSATRLAYLEQSKVEAASLRACLRTEQQQHAESMNERLEALAAYDAEVFGRREEVTRCHAEMGKLRAEVARLRNELAKEYAARGQDSRALTNRVTEHAEARWVAESRLAAATALLERWYEHTVDAPDVFVIRDTADWLAANKDP